MKHSKKTCSAGCIGSDEFVVCRCSCHGEVE